MSTGEDVLFLAVPTPNCQRVAIALEEFQCGYRTYLVDRTKDEHRSPEFLSINPAGRMPVIVDPQGIDGGIVTIAQSGAILIYLAEKMGAGLPTVGRARTAALQWLMHVLTDTNAISSSLHLSNNKVPEKHAPTIAALEERLLTFLRDCDQVLQCDAYLAGELSIADFALYPLVANRRSWIDQQTGLDQLRQWADALARRPSVAKGMQFHLNSSRNTLPTQTLPTISATLSKAKMQQPGPFMWS